jgi:hypothetical protein
MQLLILIHELNGEGVLIALAAFENAAVGELDLDGFEIRPLALVRIGDGLA